MGGWGSVYYMSANDRLLFLVLIVLDLVVEWSAIGACR